MKIRAKHYLLIPVPALMILVACGILLNSCKKFEVSRAIIVTTDFVDEVTPGSCKVSGTLVDVGSAGVSEHGFCWSLTPNPEEIINCIFLGRTNERGTFCIIIGGFSPGTRYYIWAFGDNEDGRKYGQALDFTTLSADLPTVHTNPVEEKSPTTALVGGSISDDGGAEIFEKGVCSDVNLNPTVETNVMHAGGNSEPFELTIEGLIPNTIYFVRAFASNAAGTGYGENQEFRTRPEFGEVLDARNGRSYPTVQIGELVWMAQNLDIGEMINGGDPAMDDDAPQKYCYNNDPANCEMYGGLYSWPEMMQYHYDTPQGVCPAGWHIPSDEEWRIMEVTLGFTPEQAHGEEWRGEEINAGGMLKSPDNLWDAPNVGATDEIGFHAMPAGVMNSNGNFWGVRTTTVFWSSSLEEPYAWIRQLGKDHAGILRSVADPETGFSVRCVKD